MLRWILGGREANSSVEVRCLLLKAHALLPPAWCVLSAFSLLVSHSSVLYSNVGQILDGTGQYWIEHIHKIRNETLNVFPQNVAVVIGSKI